MTVDSMQYRGERTEERERDRVILKMARPPRCETLLKSRREFGYRIAKSLSEKVDKAAWNAMMMRPGSKVGFNSQGAHEREQAVVGMYTCCSS